MNAIEAHQLLEKAAAALGVDLENPDQVRDVFTALADSARAHVAVLIAERVDRTPETEEA